MSYNTDNYREQGGSRTVIGGSLDVVSGGEIDIESGGALKLAGTEVTASAAELNELDASAVGGAVKVKKLPIESTPTGSAQDTGWDLPAKAAVLGVFVDVTTAEATGTTKTLDVGTAVGESGDPDGWLDGVSVAAEGVVKGTLLNTGQTLGALLRADEDGSGVLVPEHDVASGGKSVVYTAGSGDFAEFRGAIYVVYLELGV